MEYASKGAAALAASDPTAAISFFTKALIEHPTSPDYFTQRSTAFTRLQPPRHDLALKDAEYAVLLGRKRAKREKIQAGQQRRVVSLYGTGQYADAKFILQTMEKWRPKENKKDKMEGDMWMARIEGKLKNIPDSNQSITVKEYPDFDLPDQEELRKMLQGQLDVTESLTIEGNKLIAAEEDLIQDLNIESDPSKENIQDSNTNNILPSQPTTVVLQSKIRHEWYQNSQSVIITIYAKGVSKEKVTVEIQTDSVYISFPHPSNMSSDFTFSIDPLYSHINPKASTWRVLSTKLEITLAKVSLGQKWANLEGTDPLEPINDAVNDQPQQVVMSNLQKPQPMASSTAPAYPTSSRSGPKNWDKLATDLTAKKKKDKKSDSGADKEDDDDVDSDYDTGDAVDGFFKKLYAGADPDTRRAMMKSFQESNGTALSTNWSEVGKGKVEPVKSKDDS